MLAMAAAAAAAGFEFRAGSIRTAVLSGDKGKLMVLVGSGWSIGF